MGDQVTTGQRLRYAFDKSMAAGPVALIGWLAIVTMVVIVIAATLLAVTGIGPGERLGFGEAAWQSLMRTMDAGAVGGDEGWSYRGITLFVTFVGILVFSALISVISAGLDSALESLRKGRSQVLETGQTIILNWSPSIFDIISELCVANASEKKPRIVILADKDKVEMEDEIAAKVGPTGRTQIICRSGDPTDLFDLTLANPATCKSIIVLSPQEATDPDSNVIKTVLALTNDPRRRQERYRIAAELRDEHNAEVARIVGGDEVQLVLADDLISRIVVHSSRQSGLSAVYSELLDFDGCEIYTCAQPDLTGRTYGEALSAYRDSAILGLCDASGRVKLNPAMSSVITEADEMIIVAEDDAAIRLAAAPDGAVNDAAILKPKTRRRKAERVLILGWNRRGGMIARQLARFVRPGSVLTIAADTPDLAEEVAGLDLPNTALTVECRVVDTSRPAAIEALDAPSYDSVMVLGYSDTMEPQQADTRTLITLLHLRQIAERAGVHVGVVSEMTDVRNRELAEVTRADDFVVSNKLVSLMLAQASENERLSAIFEDLLDEAGSEFYMRPVGDYADISEPLSFYTLLESARRRDETAIGYRRRRDDQPADGRNMGGVVVNPDKAEVLLFQPEDRLIVLAEG